MKPPPHQPRISPQKASVEGFPSRGDLRGRPFPVHVQLAEQLRVQPAACGSSRRRRFCPTPDPHCLTRSRVVCCRRAICSRVCLSLATVKGPPVCPRVPGIVATGPPQEGPRAGRRSRYRPGAGSRTARSAWFCPSPGVVGAPQVPGGGRCRAGAGRRSFCGTLARCRFALGRAAIASTQQMAIPPRAGSDPGWIPTALGELERVAVTPPGSAEPPATREMRPSRQITRRFAPSPKSVKAA